MSWPADTLPRFKPTGPYGCDGAGQAHVLDRAYSHMVVATCRARSLEVAAAMAAAKAVRLNLAFDPWYSVVEEDEAA